MRTIKRYLSLLLAISLVFIICTACGPKQTSSVATTSGGTTAGSSAETETTGSTEKQMKSIKIGIAYDPNSLDPAEINLDSAYEVGFTIYEPLLRDIEGKVEPGAAVSWQHSDDRKEWTFVLRDSTFSDGTPITANDFYFSIMRTIDPEAGHGNASSLLYLENANDYYNGEAKKEDVGVVVVDEKTLKLTYSIPMFETEFTNFSYTPIKAELATSLGIEYGSAADKLLCNGPFILSEWATDSKVTVVKNENYWDADNIHMDEITFLIGASASDTAVDMLLTGDLDMASFTSMNQINSLVDAGYTYKSITTSYRCLNLNHQGSSEAMTPFMSNVNFRKALNLAIDRENLCASVLTTDEPAYRLTAPSELGYEKAFNEEYPYRAWPTKADPEQARAFLEKALEELGKTAEDIPELVLLCYESESSVTVLSAVQDMLKQVLGLKSTISSQTIGNMISMAYDGAYDLWLGGNATASPDWLSFVYAYHSDSYKTTPRLRGYTSPEFDALYDKVAQCTDYKERKDALFELEKFFCENVLNIIVSWTNTYYVSHPSVTNVYFRADGNPYLSMIDKSE